MRHLFVLILGLMRKSVWAGAARTEGRAARARARNVEENCIFVFWSRNFG